MILRHVNIEPTNKCNLNCDYCGDRKERKTGFMTLKMYRKILSMIPHETEVRLFLSGEPFLHPKICKMIELALKDKHKVLIHSNGFPVTRRHIEELDWLASDYPYDIHISFSMHKGFVPKGVKLLIDRETQINITLQHIIPYPKPLVVPQYLESYKAIPQYNLNIHLRHPHNWDQVDSIKNSEPQKFKLPCGFLEDSVAIYWNGDVTTCCADLNGDRVFGHIDAGWDWIVKTYDLFCDWQKVGFCPACKGCERYENANNKPTR